MGNVIDFLEQVGRDASLRYGDGFNDALHDGGLDEPERAALADGDTDALRLLLKQGVHLSTQMGDPFEPDRERSPEQPSDDEPESDEPPESDA